LDLDKDLQKVIELVMLRGVRRVIELEVRREVLGLTWIGLGIELGLCRRDGSGFDVRTPRRWEKRTHLPSYGAQEKLRAYFQVASIAMLGIGSSGEAARWRTYMTPEELKEEVDRRHMLKAVGTASATGAAIAAGLLLPVSDLVALAQRLDERSSLGAGDLATARRTATILGSAYAAKPNAGAVRAARMHAYTLLDRLQHATMSAETRTQLQAVASDAAALTGYGEMNAGRLDQAKSWFEAARTLARHAGDRRLEAYALAALASTSAQPLEPDHAAAVADLEAAAEFQGFLPPAGRAFVFAFLAEEHATLGHDLVSGRFLEEARAAATRVHYEEPGWGWWSTQAQLGGWDSVRPQVFAGVRSMWLGRSEDAVELFDGALRKITVPAWHASLHGHVTNACVGLGDPERACASAHAALNEAKTYELGKIPPKIRKTRLTFPARWNALAVVRELDERLRVAA
jgi:hypothetical protein